MNIYIAGPISGLKYETAFANFERAERSLADLGFDPVNPMKANGLDGTSGQHSWEDFMRKDIPLLIACEGIYLLQSWQRSRGAALEFEIATALKMPIIHEPANSIARKEICKACEQVVRKAN